MQRLPYFIYSIWFVITVLQLIGGKSEAPYIFNSIMFAGSAFIYFVASQKMHRGLAFVMGLFWPITLLMLLLYGIYRYSLWQQKNVTQPAIQFFKGLDTEADGFKYCCANCGTRVSKGIFGGWGPRGGSSPCVDVGKKCVPVQMPS